MADLHNEAENSLLVLKLLPCMLHASRFATKRKESCNAAFSSGTLQLYYSSKHTTKRLVFTVFKFNLNGSC